MPPPKEVEMRGFEPLASSVQGRRSPTELHPRVIPGQLVKSHNQNHLTIRPRTIRPPDQMGLPGLEPGTFPLSEECSSRLS